MKIKRFAKENILYMILAGLKKKEDKDWAFTSIFESFLGKLSKSKRYIPVKDLTEVENLNQTFKVFEGRAFNEKIHILEDTLDILGSLSKRENSELERVSWIIKNYNLYNQFRFPEVTRIPVPNKRLRKKKPTPPLLGILSGPPLI